MRWLRRALWPLVLTAGVGVLAMTVADVGIAGVDTTRVLAVLVGLAFAGSGLYAWGRRPENRLGPLMTAVGCTYLVWQILVQSDSSVLFTSGVWLSDAWVLLFVVFLLSFPGGQRTRKLDLLVVATFAIVVLPLEFSWLLVWSNSGNALVVSPNDGAANTIDWIQRTLIITGSVLLATVLIRRWTLASRPLRRTLAPVLAGSAAILLGSILVVLDKFQVEFVPARWIVHLAFIAIPLVILVGILRSRLARSSVGELLVELQADPAPAELRDALSRALRDPSLTLAYWLPQFGSWSDLHGRPVELPTDDDGRAVTSLPEFRNHGDLDGRVVHRPADETNRSVTVIERDGVRIAAIVHDPSLRDEPALLEAVTAGAGIALENAQLHAELRARLEELQGSRARIVEAGRNERKRLERNLHDGAQQRLIALSLELSLLEDELEDDPETAERLTAARREIAASLHELREVARGLHPAVVSGHGLDVALEQLVANAVVPVDLTVKIESRLPEATEVAAYYLVSESLANVAKHANASSARVEVTRRDSDVLIEIVDDGVGGADESRGSGLRGLADRVETLGGSLRVWSPLGEGTRVRAEIPCAP